ncbi:MAG: hypothetical protein HXY35_16120 [Chloroflexi bacterium]|nr:hypothetical protein [Chloroflexota bacterium]
MNLIDKYIAEVGKHLPRKNRADIEAEIRSTLEDMLEERTQGKGPADEATVMALLKEYGAPREVAATYKPHPYLIGPRMFPMFEMILRIVFAVVIGASFIGLGVNLSKVGLSGPEFASTVGEWFTGLLGGLIAAFGNIVLVFAILERTKVVDEFEKEIKDWDPKELQAEPDPDQIKRADAIATIIFTVLGLVVLNLYPNLFVIGFSNDGNWSTIPILTDVFFRFLPWINVMGLIQIAFNVFLLGQRDWKPITRILDIMIDLAGMVLAIIILRTPGVFAISSESLRALGITEAADTLARLFSVVPTIIIVIVVIATSVEVIKNLIQLLNVRAKSPYPVIK